MFTRYYNVFTCCYHVFTCCYVFPCCYHVFTWWYPVFTCCYHVFTCCFHVFTEYPISVPVWCLRLIPAVSGSVLVPVTYQLVRELGYRPWTAGLAACLIILGELLNNLLSHVCAHPPTHTQYMCVLFFKYMICWGWFLNLFSILLKLLLFTPCSDNVPLSQQFPNFSSMSQLLIVPNLPWPPPLYGFWKCTNFQQHRYILKINPSRNSNNKNNKKLIHFLVINKDRFNHVF